MRYGLNWAIILVLVLSSCKKKSADFKAVGEDFTEFGDTNEQPIDFARSKLVVEVAPQAIDPSVLAPLAGPSFSNRPFIPEVPPEAYGEDDINDFLASPRIFGIPYSVCGNGEVEPREQCDDGNLDNQDGCNVLCLFPICGNGLLEEYEECDDNDNDNDDGCTQDCIYEVCGNGRIDKLPFKDADGNAVFEECDDGNHKSGDGCSPCCLCEKCGNNLIEADEECDDGNITDGDGCSYCCKLEPVTPPAK